MIVPSKNQKTYGVLHTENYFSFLGFCKKVNSDEIQKVDVYLDDVLIDTIIANKHLQKIEDIYELDGFGFSYNLAEEYIGQKSLISFKNHETQDSLQNSPYQLLDVNNHKFNEAKFMYSLSESIDKEKIENLYSKNSIGFLAVEDNLEDNNFVEYIKELIVKFPKVLFKGFYFNDVQKEIGKRIFRNEEIDFYIPKNIYDIAKEIEIYLCNSKAKEDLKLYPILRVNSFEILSLGTNLQFNNYKQMTIEKLENILSAPLKEFMDNYPILGFKDEELDQDKSYSKTFQNAIYKRFHLDEFTLNSQSNAYEYFNFKMIEYGLQSKEFKQFYFDMVEGQHKVLYGN